MKKKSKKRARTKAALKKTAEQRGVALIRYIEPPPKRRTRMEIADAILQRIISGQRVHAACSAEGITWPTLWEWKLNDSELAIRYARAREASAESWEDKATQHVESADVDTVQLSRLREDNARWRAKMANPRKFADRLPADELGALERIGLEALLAGAYRKAIGNA